MLQKSDFTPLGIGTWGIGGYAEPSSNHDDQAAINALGYCFSRGMNYVQTVYMYAKGRTVELLARSLKDFKIDKESIFLSLSVYPQTATTINDFRNEVEKFLRQCRIEYLDNLQFTMRGIAKIGIDETANLVMELAKSGKIRYASLTNANLDFLRQFHNAVGKHMFAHEACYNFEIRENEEVLDYCRKHDILNVIYQPLRRNRTSQRNWPLLLELAKKYKRTQNQIILSWLRQKGFLALIKSVNHAHVDENLSSMDLQLEVGDVSRLDAFAPPGYSSPQIDWYCTGKGVTIDQLPNIFDKQMDEIEHDKILQPISCTGGRI